MIKVKIDSILKIPEDWKFTGRIKYVNSEENDYSHPSWPFASKPSSTPVEYTRMFLEVEYKSWFKIKTRWLIDYRFNIYDETIVECN